MAGTEPLIRKLWIHPRKSSVLSRIALVAGPAFLEAK